ncbi:hypothetical protein C4579_03175 [Candidatus Microgenomates bacterium]|nr:MAG: hypothetical protein C4579_03175 [Candidatus Microgenomates bacterium]
MLKYLFIFLIAWLIGAGVGYYFGYDLGFEKAKGSDSTAIISFADCVRAGYPVMESYPEQCRTPDGRTFVRDVVTPPLPPEDPIEGGEGYCPLDAKVCADGSTVERVPPNCEFRPCPEDAFPGRVTY